MHAQCAIRDQYKVGDKTKIPGPVCFNTKFSSSNFFPYIDFPTKEQVHNEVLNSVRQILSRIYSKNPHKRV